MKHAYYRGGLCPELLARHTYGDGEGLAEFWDFKDKKWVPSAGAWKIIRDDHDHWQLPEEDVEDYIARVIERSPWVLECNITAKPEGARVIEKK